MEKNNPISNKEHETREFGGASLVYKKEMKT